MDAFFQTQKDAPELPTGDNKSLSVCSNCLNVGVFQKPTSDSALSIRRLNEDEWIRMLTKKDDVVARIDAAKAAIVTVKLKLKAAESTPSTVSSDISEYLE